MKSEIFGLEWKEKLKGSFGNCVAQYLNPSERVSYHAAYRFYKIFLEHGFNPEKRSKFFAKACKHFLILLHLWTKPRKMIYIDHLKYKYRIKNISTARPTKKKNQYPRKICTKIICLLSQIKKLNKTCVLILS